MKKKAALFRILALVLMIAILAGCGGKSDEESGKKGNDPVESAETADPSAPDQDSDGPEKYGKYVGIWANEDMGPENTTAILEVQQISDVLSLKLGVTGCAQPFITVSADKMLSVSEIENDTVAMDLQDDLFGYDTTVTVKFAADGVITCQIEEDEALEMAGIYGGTCSLRLTPDARAKLDEMLDDFWEDYGEIQDYGGGEWTEPDVYDPGFYQPPTPTYDTSKASGILASSGLTEEQFRSMCVPLSIGNIHKETTAYYVDYKELLRNPNAYIGQPFVICRNQMDWDICPYCGGSGEECPASDGPTSKYVKGVHYFYGAEDILKPEQISGANREGTDRYLLKDRTICIYDLRDDIYAPNITREDWVIPYMIFNGAEGGDKLNFLMLCCDVGRND